jgi:hypothetical protein
MLIPAHTQRLLSSKNVVRLYLRSFTAAAAGLMDEVDIGAAAADFQEQYIQDPRWVGGCTACLCWGGYCSTFHVLLMLSMDSSICRYPYQQI